MLNLILFGPPGSGKGTQALKLKDHYGLEHISTGDIFRAELAAASILGKRIKALYDAGQLVPDELTFEVLIQHIDKNQLLNGNGIMFDGFPRTIKQGELLDEYFNLHKTFLAAVLSLLAGEENVVQRILLRGKASGRSDDNDENIVRHRLKVYHHQTAPLADYYRKKNIYYEIQGEGSVDEVFTLLCAQIDRLA